jgi:hypothetical protein
LIMNEENAGDFAGKYVEICANQTAARQ